MEQTAKVLQFEEELPSLADVQAKMAPAIQGMIDLAAITYGLHAREREVLEGMFDGLEYAEIAAKLRIAPGTIKVTANRIYSRFGIQSDRKQSSRRLFALIFRRAST